MTVSRRHFVTGVAALAAAGAASKTGAAGAEAERPTGRPTPETTYQVHPIGWVENRKGRPVRIVLFEKYAPGLKGLEGWSHVHVFWWFDKNDTPQRRAVLQVHPRGNRQNPLTGVFACRAPVRPNLIALTVCKVVAVEGPALVIDRIDAFDGTPVLDLKPVIPPDMPREGFRVPDWARGGPRRAAQ